MDYEAYRDVLRAFDIPIIRPNLRTGEGHGHCRDFYRERPAKDKLKKLRKHTKMAKASKRRNRK